MKAVSVCSGNGGLRRTAGAFLALFLAALLCAGMGAESALAASSERLDGLKDQAKQLSGQESELQRQLDALENQAASKLNEKALLEQQISVLSAQIVNTEAMIAEYDAQIAAKQVELEEAQAKEDEYFSLFCQRFRDMEEQGAMTYWSILFGSASFSDLLDRLNFVADVVRYDNHIVGELQSAREAVASAKADLETQQSELASAKAELESQKTALAADEAAVDAAIAEINSQAADYEAQLAEIAAQADELESQIASAQRDYDAAVAAEKAAAAQEPSSGTGRIGMIWPTTSRRITSYFGRRNSPTAGASSYHQGLDIGASKGSAIYAAASGTVSDAGYNSARGNYVVVSHGSGVSTVYMHCSALYVSAGQSVSQGQTIAAVGSTGISTGPHLHFGVIQDGSYVNPLNYVSP